MNVAVAFAWVCMSLFAAGAFCLLITGLAAIAAAVIKPPNLKGIPKRRTGGK